MHIQFKLRDLLNALLLLIVYYSEKLYCCLFAQDLKSFKRIMRNP